MSFIVTVFVVCFAFASLGWRALIPLIPGWPWRVALGVFMFIMTIPPFLVWRLEAAGPAGFWFSRLWSLFQWNWTVLMMWLSLMALPLFLWNGAAWGAAKIAARAGQPASAALIRPVNPRHGAMALCGLTLTLFVWGLAEAHAIRLQRVHIVAPAESGLRKPLRLAFISDVHLSLFRHDWLSKRTVALAQSLRADALISGGDFFDGKTSDVVEAAARFQALKPPLGKFGILGNHEWYSGVDEAIKTHRLAGITLLRGQQTRLRDDVLLAGSDDEAGEGRSLPFIDAATSSSIPASQRRFHGPDEIPQFFHARAADGAAPPTHGRPFVIYLHHQPLIPAAARGKFDLMLSGHTHNGQIFPFGWLVKLRYQWLKGLHALPGGGQIYVSPGTGTWGPSLRVLARPEVTLLEITPGKP